MAIWTRKSSYSAFHYTNENDDIVASFPKDARLAMELFHRGCASNGSLAIYDADVEQFIIGNIGQLAA